MNKRHREYFKVIDTTNGLIIARSDNKIRTILNAIDGIKIQSHDGVGWVDKLYADTNGNLKVQNVDVKGNIDCSSLKIGGVSALTTNDKISVNAIENLVVGGNVTMGSNATISWGNVTSKPSIPTLPSYITSTKITSTTIESPSITGGTITGGSIVGGSITSNTDINVTRDVNVQGNVVVRGNDFEAFVIKVGSTTKAEIYYEPVADSLRIDSAGSIYANNNRIDTAQVAVFG